MKGTEFIGNLYRLEKPTFTIKDAARIIGKNENYTRLFINRLKKGGRIKEIEGGKYTILTEPLPIASNIIFPSYISFITALSYYGLITQLPLVILVASLKPKKGLNIMGQEVKFIKLSKERFFGYRKEKVQGKFIFIAEPEKAVIDSLLLPTYCPIGEAYNAITSGELGKAKLVEYCLRVNSKVVAKRLGYFLEKAGHEPNSELIHAINTSYDKLNPSLPSKGKRDKRWRLIINEAV
ncbi:MAG: hypothetical protein ABIB71_08725 [Candidatus Woesearchaeota archaeon]